LSTLFRHKIQILNSIRRILKFQKWFDVKLSLDVDNLAFLGVVTVFLQLFEKLGSFFKFSGYPLLTLIMTLKEPRKGHSWERLGLNFRNILFNRTEVASNKLSLLLEILFQDTQTLQLNLQWVETNPSNICIFPTDICFSLPHGTTLKALIQMFIQKYGCSLMLDGLVSSHPTIYNEY
jgi:hypothetical protein